MTTTATEPRIKLVDPATATGRTKELFDGPIKGKHINLFRGLINSPAALQAYLGMGAALGEGELTPREREAVQLAVAQENNCEYCLAAHTKIGTGAGLSVEQTLGARRGSVDDQKLDALVKFAKALHQKRGHVSDEDLERFRAAGYGDGAIAEVVAGYAQATLTNFFNHVAGTPVDFPSAQPI